ncbi:toprim domain-containing protein [Nocardia sp. IFM 10818]
MHESGGGHHNPSLAVKYLPAEQKTKVKCFAGCDDRDILGTLGLKVRDLYDNPITRSTRDSRRARAPRVRPRQISPADRAIDAAGLPLTQPKKEMGEQLSPWRLTDAYPYMRADGEIAGEVVRKEADFERGRDKKFTQRRWNTQTGEFEPGGFEALPFQLPQLLEGIRNGRWVYVCEGEKDVLNAEKAGLCATTNAGGALSWTPEHARYLHGAVGVVIVADHDTPATAAPGRSSTAWPGSPGRCAWSRRPPARTSPTTSTPVTASTNSNRSRTWTPAPPVPFPPRRCRRWSWPSPPAGSRPRIFFPHTPTPPPMEDSP